MTRVFISAVLASLACMLAASCSKSDGSAFPPVPVVEKADIDGLWLMYDGDEPETVVAVYPRGGKRYAKMVAIYHDSKMDDTIEKPIERAKGLDGKPPLCGLDFVWDLIPSSDGKFVGKVVNPDDGGVYRCKLWLDADSKKLVLRGELFVFGANEYLVPFEQSKLPFKLDIAKLSPNPPCL